jgi:hypothetical protein
VNDDAFAITEAARRDGTRGRTSGAVENDRVSGLGRKNEEVWVGRYLFRRRRDGGTVREVGKLLGMPSRPAHQPMSLPEKHES